MRKILTILTICLITILGANYLVENYMNKIGNEKLIEIEKSEKIKRIENNNTKIENNNKKIEKISKEEVDNKLENLRKRFESKGLIQRGDTYFANEQHKLAQDLFLKALKENPEDKKIIKKIGDTYFEMNRFPRAYSYYKKLVGAEFINSKKIAITYFFTLPKEKEKLNFKEIYKNIDSFKLEKDDTFFYKTSVECIFNKDTCQNKFKTYIKNYNGVNQNILFIKQAFNDYESFQVKEQYALDTRILVALFNAQMYGITNILAKDILEDKPDYLTIIKVLAKGYYEIGDYKEAKKYLLKYNKIDSSDPKVNYMLGIININLHEYILSNIYFIKALKSGYKNKVDISRRLIYNYYLHGESTDKMIAEFKNLIENGDGLNSTDYSLAIYYTLINGENNLANKWTSKALQLFPKDDNFYGYKGWIYKESGDYDKAEYYLKQGLKLNIGNPLINLNMGLINADKGKLLKAKIFLKNTIKEDTNGEFGKLATKKLEEILLEEEELKNKLNDFSEF
ncbi:MAG: hypothetical protein Q9M94_06075 [Candidatus Gracilibacteria bacterium]|nr:hypothetical protein [Candidatus Gracilibacteria bacterium]